jgi:hypothetical protein
MCGVRQRQFINMALQLMTEQYNHNRMKLHKLMNNVYSIPEPVSIFLNVQQYKESDIYEIKRLVREQIKINKMITTGKNMIIHIK